MAGTCLLFPPIRPLPLSLTVNIGFLASDIAGVFQIANNLGDGAIAGVSELGQPRDQVHAPTLRFDGFPSGRCHRRHGDEAVAVAH